MFWLGYAISYALLWYQNRWIVESYPLDRPLWFSPSNQLRFLLVRLVLTYGSLAGLLYRYGMLVAAVALLAIQLFGRVTFKYYFGRKVLETAKRYFGLKIVKTANGLVDVVKEDADPRKADREMWQNAVMLARREVIDNMGGLPRLNL